MARPNLSTLRGDLFGGITAAVVALPLALAFGVASGAGAIAGLYGAIAVGFFAALFGGTPAQVSGPTGPMTVVMGAVVAQGAGNLAEAFAIVCLGGALQVGFGLLRVGRFVSYTPYSVVSGFMSGIGVIIIVIQVLPFLGLPAAEGGPLEAIRTWPAMAGELQPAALTVACVSLAAMIFWPTPLRRMLPPPLAALLLGTGLAVFAFPGVPVIGEVPTGLPQLLMPAFDPSRLGPIFQSALILALLGSIDSLLTSLVADTITRTRHNSDRELIGQGIGNIVAGLIGGLPGAGATMRTVINVRAGGRTRLSGIVHALVLLALVLGLGPLAERIPHAALAGILIKVGWDIIDWGYLKRIRRAPRDKVVVMAVTLVLTVFVDLITAVAIGLILAGFATSRWMEQEQLKGILRLALPNGDSPLSEEERAALQAADGRIGVVMLRGSFSYASARELVRRAGLNAAGEEIVIFDFTNAAYIDTSAALSIEELLDKAQADGSVCFVCGLSGSARSTLAGLGVLDRLPDGHDFATRLDAVRAAVRRLEPEPAFTASPV